MTPETNITDTPEVVVLSLETIANVWNLPRGSRVDLGEHKFFIFILESSDPNRSAHLRYFTTVDSPGLTGGMDCNQPYPTQFRHLRKNPSEDSLANDEFGEAVFSRESLRDTLASGKWYVG